MSSNRAARLLMMLGGGAFVLAATWWYLSFKQMFGDGTKRAIECFYHDIPACEVAETLDLLFAIPAYTPYAFYAALGLFILGLISFEGSSDGGGHKDSHTGAGPSGAIT